MTGVVSHRLHDRLRILQIDMRCINQSNTRERNHQVAQMGRIYSQASRVIAWIRVEWQPLIQSTRDDVKIAADLLEDLSTGKTFAQTSGGASNGPIISCTPCIMLDGLDCGSSKNIYLQPA